MSEAGEHEAGTDPGFEIGTHTAERLREVIINLLSERPTAQVRRDRRSI